MRRAGPASRAAAALARRAADAGLGGFHHAAFGVAVCGPVGAVPPIHIIVKNGRLTLEGVVANQMDKQLAVTRATGLSGVFAVTNNLRVEE